MVNTCLCLSPERRSQGLEKRKEAESVLAPRKKENSEVHTVSSRAGTRESPGLLDLSQVLVILI